MVKKIILKLKRLDWPGLGSSIAVFSALFIFLAAVFQLAGLTIKPEIEIAGERLKVEVADSPEEIRRGLSGREKLGDNQGMLFVYDGYYLPRFWMAEMRFPLDIIWIKDGTVVGFEENLPPLKDNRPIYYHPKTFVNCVLEVPAGFSARTDLKIGDRVDFGELFDFF